MNAIFRHAKFQVPLVQMRDRISSVWRGASSLLKLYQPLSEEENAVEQHGAVPFKGDIPRKAGDAHHQFRLVYKQPRPAAEKVENLIVTPEGAGWKDGRLFEKYSAGKPGLRMLAGAHAPVREVDEGYFIQSEHTDTFGDWTSEYLSPLSLLPEISAPVFLPRSMAKKAYVRRDAERTGLQFVDIDAPIRIRNATVVRLQRYIRYWRAKDVMALRKLLNVEPVTPQSGSLLYLSRYGETSEVATRTHPNLMIEEVIKERGGVVLRTGETRLEDYLNAARYAETILYDHGSAAYNMIYWSPKRAVEFVSDAWWMNSFLFFAEGLGVHDYNIICTDRGGLDSVRDRLNAVLDAPL
ncbi:glycosyltransferase 61 family protein [Hyphococcus sp.]|uniref:glycosyltransferase 61 family protein n=1 Tax=Hyphococcus sp. TaxID=2038636 RepID=UPI003CCBEC9A